MANPIRTSEGALKAVFAPTAMAYVWAVVGYPKAGVALFLAFMIGAYCVGLFKDVSAWPLISKVALACGPPLIGLGWYLSTLKATDVLIAPDVVYGIVSVAGWLALKNVD